MSTPVVGQRYRHFRTKDLYEVERFADYTESTSVVMVIYKNVATGKAYARPLESWKNPTPDGRERFALVQQAPTFKHGIPPRDQIPYYDDRYSIPVWTATGHCMRWDFHGDGWVDYAFSDGSYPEEYEEWKVPKDVGWIPLPPRPLPAPAKKPRAKKKA